MFNNSNTLVFLSDSKSIDVTEKLRMLHHGGGKYKR